MTAQLSSDFEPKAVVSVAEISRQVGLSRTRFYQLVKAGVFPFPIYDVETRRPGYLAEQQRQCLEVRARNCGINGKPILFYAKKPAEPKPSIAHRHPIKSKATPIDNANAELLAAIQALGMASVTATDIANAVRETFPNGAKGVAENDMIRAVFLHLKRQDSGDNDRR